MHSLAEVGPATPERALPSGAAVEGTSPVFVVPGWLSIVAGLILDVTKARQEFKRLTFLSMPRPGLDG